eukprot:TRINITY_DN50456_c0_g1_i1.p4 TRINITY_DN50456_c0_g1~~TRINITY_DN50456_c0_g1_i1.p4  ORF type:complete len:115 (-),score=10.03 TRINITY_DN50456_c0_g1_i1:264-608(-)
MKQLIGYMCFKQAMANAVVTSNICLSFDRRFSTLDGYGQMIGSGMSTAGRPDLSRHASCTEQVLSNAALRDKHRLDLESSVGRRGAALRTLEYMITNDAVAPWAHTSCPAGALQ